MARDFIDADLDTAFALLYPAENQEILPNNRSHALRAIDEAQNVIRDGEKRLSALSDCDRERLRVALERTRVVIESVGATLPSGDRWLTHVTASHDSLNRERGPRLTVALRLIPPSPVSCAHKAGDNRNLQESWRTAIVQADDSTIRLRGYDITELMQRATFADTLFLLHRERLPDRHERRLLDAILTSVADHGSGAPSCATARLAASGNRESLSAAIAAGILAIGNDHGGAGAACMSMIAEGVALARAKSIALGDAARQIVDQSRASKQRLPGMGHRVHSVDPRTAVLFAMAREEGVAGDGVLFMEALDTAVREKIKPLPINIDGALAAILHDLGFPPEAGKLIFIVGRVAGLTAEVAEEYAREKPMRIRVPVQYDGVPPRSIE